MKLLFFLLVTAMTHQAFAKSYFLKCERKSLVKLSATTVSICRYDFSEDDCKEAPMSYTEIDKAEVSKDLSTAEKRVYYVEGIFSGSFDLVTVSQNLLDALENGQTTSLPGFITYNFGSLDYSISRCNVWDQQF